MDHEEQHRKHHREEREHHKEEKKHYDQAHEKQNRLIHPTWFLMIGVVLVVAVIMVWTMI